MKKKCRVTLSSFIKKTMLFAGVGLCLAQSFPARAAEQVGTFEGHPVFNNEFGGVHIEDGGSTSDVTRRGAAFAAKYDPRPIGAVSSRVEDQGQYNTCWAFATIAAIECNLIKKGYEDSSVNLSENHLAYFFYNRQVDPIRYTVGDKNKNLKDTWIQNGGTIYGTAQSLATWSGVVKESVPEDNAKGEYVPTDLPPEACYNSDYRLIGTYFYDYDVKNIINSINTIKQAIMDYGAVTTGIYTPETKEEANTYYNSSNGSFYYNKDGGNHAVTIVGWDDDYSKEKFNIKCQPKGNGAWIVKNSYGTDFGDGGYIYVSYEDLSLREIAAYDMVKATDCYNNNYQYDGTGATGLYYYQASGTTFANVFEARAAQSGCNENLRAVGINVLTSNVQYSVQIYTGVTDSTNPTSGKAVLKSPQTGTITKAGYNQIALNEPVTLTSGEKYAVVITLKTANGDKVKVGCDFSFDAEWIAFESFVGPGQSFVKVGGTWLDTGRTTGASRVALWGDDKNGRPIVAGYTYSNIRIKAYTDNTNEKTTYKLNSKNLGISKGSSQKMSLEITPNTVKRKITWSSSNKKVATISSSGKIKGKVYGTTTIKAKFVAGGSTKTLSCKVTVGPSKIKNFKASGGKNRINVTWKKNSGVSGYAVYYSTERNGKYKSLATITSSSKTKCTKKKVSAGTYYVKMRPYIVKNGKKLFGSYTAVKEVQVN